MKKEDILKLSSGEVFEKLHTQTAGLSEAEAKARLLQYGENTFKKDGTSVFKIFLGQFKSSLIYLLIVAAALSFFLGDSIDGFIILAILIVNAGLGFLQEYRSEKAIEKLSKLIEKQALVKRGGKTEFVNENLIVPGDIVIVREGDIISADIKLFEAEDLLVNESQLTGESASVAKSADAKESGALLFAGSIVEKGAGTGAVYATAENTELGKIAALSESTKKVTQYEKSLTDFSNFLIRIILFTLLVVLIGKIIITHDITHIPTLLLFIIALAITVIPEALPVIAIVTLSQGALRLAKQHVVVKRLSSLEDLGNVNMLCTDKTGTLTENTLSITEIVSPDAELFQTLAYASITSFGTKKKKITDAFDLAFSHYVSSEIQKKAEDFVQVKELPFDPNSRRRWIILQNSKTKKDYLVELGSAESLLAIAKADKKKEYTSDIAEDGKQGIRHLAIAYKEISYAKDFDILKNEDGLLFLGYAKMIDPLRPTAKETIRLAETLGVNIKILTGDSEEVAGYVAREVGLMGKSDIIYSGDQFEAMSLEEKKAAVLACNVFARVTPEQKYAIIELLKENFIVGYQGDGINDAPSLKLADVAIAVDSATDVAKDSSDIVLLKKDLHVIISGIQYGRSIFVNVNKYIKHTMVGNFGSFISIGILYLVSASLPQLPIQLLLCNLITDLPLLSIFSDRVDLDEVKDPEKYNVRSLMFISLALATFTALYSFIYFAFVGFTVTVQTETSLFLFLTFTQLIIILSVRNKGHMWQGAKPSALVLWSIGAFFLLTLGITYFAPLAHLFSFTPLPLISVAIILVFTIAYIFILDAIKVYYFSFQDRVKRKS